MATCIHCGKYTNDHQNCRENCDWCWRPHSQKVFVIGKLTVDLKTSNTTEQIIGGGI